MLLRPVSAALLLCGCLPAAAELTFHTGQLAGTTAYLSDFHWGTGNLAKGDNLTAAWLDVSTYDDAPLCSVDELSGHARSAMTANFTGKVCFVDKWRFSEQTECAGDEYPTLVMQELGCVALVLGTQNPDGYAAHGVDDDGRRVGGDWRFWSVDRIAQELKIPTFFLRTYQNAIYEGWHGPLVVTTESLREAAANATSAGAPIVVTVSRQKSSAYADFANSPLVIALEALYLAPACLLGIYMCAIRLWCFAHPPKKKQAPQYFSTPQKVLYGEIIVNTIAFMVWVIELPLGLARGHFTYPFNRLLFTVGNPIFAAEAVLLSFFWAEITGNFSGRKVMGLQRMRRPFIGFLFFFFLLDIGASVGATFKGQIWQLAQISAFIGVIIIAFEVIFFRIYGKRIISAMNSSLTGQGDKKKISASDSAQARNLLAMSKRIMLASTFMIMQIVTNLLSFGFLWGKPWATLFIVVNAFTWNRATGMCMVLCFNPPGTKNWWQPSFLVAQSTKDKSRKVSTTKSKSQESSSSRNSSFRSASSESESLTSAVSSDATSSATESASEAQSSDSAKTANSDTASLSN